MCQLYNCQMIHNSPICSILYFLNSRFCPTNRKERPQPQPQPRHQLMIAVISEQIQFLIQSMVFRCKALQDHFLYFFLTKFINSLELIPYAHLNKSGSSFLHMGPVYGVLSSSNYLLNVILHSKNKLIKKNIKRFVFSIRKPRTWI